MDVIEDIFSEVANELESYIDNETRAKLEDLESRVRQRWGGTKPYIRKSAIKRKAQEAALNDINRGVPLKEAMQQNGVPRATLYNLLKHRQRSKNDRRDITN